MSTPIIPVLMAEVNRLTKPTDIIKYILRSYVSYPRNINDTFSDREISFVYDLAALGWQLDSLRDQSRINLTNVLRYYFPTASSLDVDVTLVQTGDVNYSIQFDIVVVIDGQTHQLSHDYKVDHEGRLIYTFGGN